MADLRRLEKNDKDRSQIIFENLSTRIFCMELGLTSDVNRKTKQWGLQTEPVRIGERAYACLVKYCDVNARLKDMKRDFIEAIQVARQEGVTDLLLFINKDLADEDLGGDDSVYLRDINGAAREKRGDEPELRLHWWTRRRIERVLNMEKYDTVRKTYLEDYSSAYPLAFYHHVCDRFYDDTGNESYGSIPLSECYIEPAVNVKGDDGSQLSARAWIESYVGSDEYVVVLCGEPGHGKTSLCHKAVCDFYESGWLAGKVTNVFCFSLNPAGTDAIMADGQLDLYALFSWGSDRRNDDHRIAMEYCRGALVFLDGFDELLEWHPAFDLPGFIRDYILPFQQETDARVVVSTRSAVVERGMNVLQTDRLTSVSVVRLQPITRLQQLSWIQGYVQHLRGKLADGLEHLPRDRRADFEKELSELEAYAALYGRIEPEDDLRDVLGVPIIFRMVVASHYLPDCGKSITRIYDGLFDAAWYRHAHRAVDSLADPHEDAKAHLSRLALKVFLDDGDTATANNTLEFPWTSSFYTAYHGRRRFGFLHRSLYQYFLAHEVVGWFKRYAEDKDSTALRASLMCLGRRRLDDTTLGFICDIHGADPGKNSMDSSFEMAYTILQETNGFMALVPEEADAEWIETPTPLERSTNSYWNILSICSMCGHPMTTDRICMQSLKTRNLSQCHLKHSKLSQAQLDMAILNGVDLSLSDLSRAYLSHADLSGANLRGSNLGGANFHGACLNQASLGHADLSQAHLCRAYLSKAKLSGAYLCKAHLNEACLRYADLRHTDLRHADLSKAYLSSADLSEAKLSGANIDEAHLRKANLSQADLRQARLRDAHLVRASLKQADLSGADLRGADLRGADLRGAYLIRANLSQANLIGANLSQASLAHADLSGAKLDDSALKQALLLGASVKGTGFPQDQS